MGPVRETKFDHKGKASLSLQLKMPLIPPWKRQPLSWTPPSLINVFLKRVLSNNLHLSGQTRRTKVECTLGDWAEKRCWVVDLTARRSWTKVPCYHAPFGSWARPGRKKIATFHRRERRLLHFCRGLFFSRVLAKKKHLGLEKKYIAQIWCSLKSIELRGLERWLSG